MTDGEKQSEWPRVLEIPERVRGGSVYSSSEPGSQLLIRVLVCTPMDVVIFIFRAILLQIAVAR